MVTFAHPRAARRSPHAMVLSVAAVAALAAATATGCQPSWTPERAQPATSLQWPYAPAPAKVTYDHAWTGAARDRSIGTVVQTIMVGSGGQDDRFALPVAIATAADGRMAVADAGRASVHLFLGDGSSYRRLAGSADRPMESPVGLAFDARGRLYVSDSAGRLYLFDEAGNVRRIVSEGLQRPTGIVYSSARDVLYVVDTTAHVVRTFSTDGRQLSSFGGRGSGPGQLNYPTHIARSAAGEIYVTDSLNFRVAIFDEDGRFRSSFGNHGNGSGDIAMPKGIAVDADGIVYVVDAVFDNVQLFDRNGRFLLTLGARGTGFGEFWLPSGAFLSPSGRLYVCDTYNHRVQVFTVTGGYTGAAS